ncbi:MAG: hypothetical protein ACYC2K_08860 [Gemmatimonadales bacterium]
MTLPKTLGILAVVLLAALIIGRSLFTVKTTGAPRGSSARVGDAIVTMMTRLQPYVPSLHRNPENDRYTIGLLVHSARDGTVRRFINLSSDQRPSNLNQTKITGVDGSRIWFIAPETGSYDVRTEQVGWHPDQAGPARAWSPADLATGDDALNLMLIAGGFPSSTQWLGLLSETEAGSGFRPGLRLSDAYAIERSREPRRLWTTEVNRESGVPRIKGLEPLPGEGMLNAAFLRSVRDGQILRLDGDGYLMLYESKPYRAGTVMVARVGFDGTVEWTLDSGIGSLREIMPDPAYPALIGDRPRAPDTVPEPILVVIDAGKGTAVTHSLWYK